MDTTDKTKKGDAVEKKIEWTTGTKQTAMVTVSLITSKTLDADGDKITVDCCEMQIMAYIDGQFVGSGAPQKANHPVAVAKIGKLGITQTNLDRINAAIAEIEATPEWQAKKAREAQSLKNSIAYDDHRAKMRKIMGY